MAHTRAILMVSLMVGGCSKSAESGRSGHPVRPPPKTTETTQMPSNDSAPENEAEEPSTFRCTWSDENHPAKEIGFNWPDAVFSMDLSEAERKRYQEGHNEDTHVVGNSHFIRGWAPIKVQGFDKEWGFGFWIRVSKQDFADFEKRGRVDHPKYGGTIANQTLNGAPTLGLAAEMEFRGRGQRPLLRFTDTRHPLTQMQKKGVGFDEWRAWCSATFHQGEEEPAGKPFEASFAKHGWQIYLPTDLGKAPFKFGQPPKAGDTVKVGIGVLTASDTGEVKTVNAGWWVRLDDVSNRRLWSGTLASPVRLQTTLTFGSRVWLRPEQAFEYMPDEDTPE
ncbi:MAG: DUF2199 domain-containing protein [Myxococcales bacterium]|nr:DUF2199 domain-containing protein [Myxococcales bacterium]